MAADQSGRPTFPVWVGSLDENVSEKQLFRKFSKFGIVSSVKIQQDSATGKSKGFGWVNFNSREAAELSAAKLAGVAFHGSHIKTRGPAELEKKGLFSPPKADFRPITDCSFFVQGKRCKKGATVIATFLIPFAYLLQTFDLFPLNSFIFIPFLCYFLPSPYFFFPSPLPSLLIFFSLPLSSWYDIVRVPPLGAGSTDGGGVQQMEGEEVYGQELSPQAPRQG